MIMMMVVRRLHQGVHPRVLLPRSSSRAPLSSKTLASTGTALGSNCDTCPTYANTSRDVTRSRYSVPYVMSCSTTKWTEISIYVLELARSHTLVRRAYLGPSYARSQDAQFQDLKERSSVGISCGISPSPMWPILLRHTFHDNISSKQFKA